MSEQNNIDDLFSQRLDNFGVEPPEDFKKSIDEIRNDGGPVEDNNGKKLWPLIIFFIAIIGVFAWAFYPSKKQTAIVLKSEKIDSISSPNTIENTNKNSIKPAIISQSNDTLNNKSITNKLPINTNETLIVSKNNSNNIISNDDKKHDKKVPRIKRRKAQHVSVSSSIKGSNKNYNSAKNNNKNQPNFLENSDNHSVANTQQADDYAIAKLYIRPAFKMLVGGYLSADSMPTDAFANAIAEWDSLMANIAKSNRNKKQLFIEAGVSTSILFQNFNSINLKDSFSLKQPQIGVQLAAGYNYKNILFTVGFGVSQWKEQSNFVITTGQVQQTILVDSIVIIGPDTNVIYKVPLTIMVDEHKKNTLTTSYTYYQVPIMIGYSMPLKKLCIEASAGIHINLLSASKGNYKSFAENIVTPYSSKNETPLNKYYTSYLLAAGATYQLNNHFKLSMQLPVSLAAKSMYKSTYEINRKISSVGLKLNLRYTF